jgi:hypothetical protein
VSQAIQYIADLIKDGVASNDELAKDLSEWVSGGEMIAAGILPSDYESVPYGDESEYAVMPASFRLGRAEPNPFRDTARIAFDLPEAAKIQIVVYDVRGRSIRTLVNEERPAGRFTVAWNGRDDADRRVGSGTYLYVMKAGAVHAHGRMMLLR